MYGLYEKLYLRTSRCELKNVIFVSGRKGTGIYKSVKYLTAIMNEYDLYEKPDVHYIDISSSLGASDIESTFYQMCIEESSLNQMYCTLIMSINVHLI